EGFGGGARGQRKRKPSVGGVGISAGPGSARNSTQPGRAEDHRGPESALETTDSRNTGEEKPALGTGRVSPSFLNTFRAPASAARRVPTWSARRVWRDRA